MPDAAAAQVQSEILEMMGIETFDHAPAGLSAMAIRELNAVLQQIYSLLPDTFWRESDPRSTQLRAPATVSVTVVNGAKSITFISGWQSYMEGCTIVIAGDPAHNRLVMDTAASATLWLPYDGASGTVSATVYHDAVTIEDAEQVIGPVMLLDHWELVPVASERARQIMDPGTGTIASGDNWLSGLYGLFPLLDYKRNIGTPTGFLVAPAPYFTGKKVVLRLLLTALPDIAYRLTYKVKGLPPTAVDDWDDDRTWLVPYGYTESIVIPMILWRLAKHPAFPRSQQELQPAYDVAAKMLQNMRPRGHQSTSVATGDDW
jgi:hypothetical protein